MTFGTGDVVQLKSGGVVMTVRLVIGDGRYPSLEEPYKLAGYAVGDVLCEWQDGKKPKAAAYHPDQLVAYQRALGSVHVRRT